jgi:hypothetical protein
LQEIELQLFFPHGCDLRNLTDMRASAEATYMLFCHLDVNSAASLIGGAGVEAIKINSCYLDANSAASLIGKAAAEAT